MIGFAAGIVAALEFGFGRVKDLVKDLTPEQLAAVPAGFSNSIATMIVHTYGTEARLSYGLCDQKMPEAVAADLLLNLPRTQTLPEVKGQTAESLTAIMEKARGLLTPALAELSEADLDRELEMGPNRKVSIRFMLAMLPQHQGQHFGHMQMVKKAVTQA